MSTYRPYYVADQFRYPDDAVSNSAAHAQTAFSFARSESRNAANSFDYLDLEDLVQGHSQVSAVGISVSRFYARMLVTQPFEVSRFLLQTGDFGGDGPTSKSYDDYDFDEEQESSSDEEVDYFVDVRDMATRDEPSKRPRVKPARKVKPSKTRSVQLFNSRERDPLFPQALDISGGPFVFTTLGALSEKEGVFGLWHALNASCLYSAATNIVRAWSTSFLASLTGITDPQFVDIAQAVDPWKLILVSTAGCAVAAAALAPVAVIRARLISTSMNYSDRPRSLRWSLAAAVKQGQLVAPLFVVLPTTLAAAGYHMIIQSAPVLMWRLASLSQFSSPGLYQLGRAVAKILGLVVKMPLETLASRAQLKASHPTARTLIIRPVQYKGMLPSLWSVLMGAVPVSTLYRGWRTEAVGIMAEWGYAALDEGKPMKERF